MVVVVGESRPSLGRLLQSDVDVVDHCCTANVDRGSKAGKLGTWSIQRRQSGIEFKDTRSKASHDLSEWDDS